MHLKMENISMFFGSFQALTDVGLTVGEGEIHGLLGENGAGKSTLMNILAGVYTPAAGKIYIDDNEVMGMTPKKASKMGIRFIHQELSLINDLKVYENMFLTEELTQKSKIFLDKKEMIRRCTELFKQMNVDIDPLANVYDLDTSRKQLVEIAKAMLFYARLIIMDEPTTSLTNNEIEKLFELMRNLKSRGVSLIYISHKMPEIFNICDRFTVLRDGKLIETGDFTKINERKMTELMVGRSIVDGNLKEGTVQTEEIKFEADNISCEHYFKNVSFNVKKGEVVAITGLFGDGRGELSEALFGARKLTTGTIKINDKALDLRSIKGVMKSGVGMVPRSRKERSIISDMSILNNVSIANFINNHKKLFISKKEEVARFHKLRQITDIKYGNVDNYITSLSGGNQQKVILSRWLALNSDVYILDNPTQGVDVGAKFEVYKLINKLAGEGKSIILFSSEFPEIYKVSDRCLIMYKGMINAEINRSELTELNVMYYSTGSNLEVKNEQAN